MLWMSCDTDTRGAIVRVIYWLAVCCYVVGAEREREDKRSTTLAAAGQADSQVARQATGINSHSLS